jgi:hypothetical protein
MKYVSRSEALPVKLGPAGFFVYSKPQLEKILRENIEKHGIYLQV